MQTILLLPLLLYSVISRGQIVLTSDAASIIKITGLPASGCNEIIAMYKYSATPQNRATLAGQVTETLAAIPPEDRIELEAGIAYRYSLQINTPSGTTVHAPLTGKTHGENTAIFPVYPGTEGVFPLPAGAGSIQSKGYLPNKPGNVKFDGLLRFSEETSNGFLCIPYREKSRNNTIYTTNIIIPFVVGKAAQAATAAPRAEPSTKGKAASGAGIPPSAKKRTYSIPNEPIMDCAVNVHPVRQAVRPDAGLKITGTPRLLIFTRNCRTEEEEPEEIDPDLQLRVFPNPVSGATNVHYHLPKKGEVTVLIYDLQGKAVHALLQRTEQDAGPHHLQWYTAGIPSGMYIVRIETAVGFTVGRIMVAQDG